MNLNDTDEVISLVDYSVQTGFSSVRVSLNGIVATHDTQYLFHIACTSSFVSLSQYMNCCI